MKLKLREKTHLVDNIWSFVFDPEEEAPFEAGQYMRVILDHENPDEEGIKRFFTNSSAPHEGVLQIVTRITNSTFKQALAALEIGDESMELARPQEGDFVWRDSDRPIIYVAGGIGITPIHSILKHRIHEGLPIPVTLLYNGRTEDLPFRDDFANYEKTNPEFKVIYVIGERITPELLNRNFPNLNESLVYLTGPEAMVDAVGEELKAGGLPEDQLVQDWFPNYGDDSY